ncbi:MAG: GNAT family N-acetyltransferase [Clostridia bacterium]|nr:GNAT family N-acetyltransferase [Clostridia bacterium]
MKSLSWENFDEFYSMLNMIFPSDEHRDYQEQKNLLLNPEYTVKFIDEDEKIIAFVAYWHFREFLYVEHLAVDNSKRNQGLGSLLLSFLCQNTDKIIILEIEPPIDLKSKSRMNFYIKNGFYFNEYDYIQPAYSDKKSAIALNLMSFGRKINENEFINIRKILYERVYDTKMI